MTGDRDRDEAGRPRSARPRDGLGRPLPPGAQGEPTMPEDLALAPDEALDLAQRLLDSGRPFHAHEVLESAWKTADTSERDLWQGLAQLAVGVTHAMRGNPVGAQRLVDRGAANLAQYNPRRPHGIDVPGVLAWCRGFTPERTAPLRLRGLSGPAPTIGQ